MTILSNLQDYIFHHNGTYWRCIKRNNVYYYLFCTKDGVVTNNHDYYWFSSVDKELDLRKMKAFGAFRINNSSSLSPVCYKIQQLENRFKERQAKRAQA